MMWCDAMRCDGAEPQFWFRANARSNEKGSNGFRSFVRTSNLLNFCIKRQIFAPKTKNRNNSHRFGSDSKSRSFSVWPILRVPKHKVNFMENFDFKEALHKVIEAWGNYKYEFLKAQAFSYTPSTAKLKRRYRFKAHVRTRKSSRIEATQTVPLFHSATVEGR